jgi:KDO2-lipid IV(A) lauroyltransferase
MGGRGTITPRPALDSGVIATRALETVLVRALGAGARALPWRASLAAGAALGDLARRIGIRRRVAETNLEHAFPDRGTAQRATILRAHYRELGRIAVEYARFAELARAPLGQVVGEIRGLEHLERAKAAGRGAILLSGHFGNVELLGAALGQVHPVDLVVRPLSNPGVEAWIAAERTRAGVGLISADTGTRAAYRALRGNRWIAMLADQDARRHGVFVPFLGRPASTALGPARIALATGAPIIMGFCWRGADGRHTLEVDPPLDPGDPRDPRAAERLTALHVARLEQRVRERPECWFWLHRRWKTAPPAAQP